MAADCLIASLGSYTKNKSFNYRIPLSVELSKSVMPFYFESPNTKHFDTSNIPGRNNLCPVEFTEYSLSLFSRSTSSFASSSSYNVDKSLQNKSNSIFSDCQLTLPPLDMEKTRRIERRREKEESLSGWYGITKKKQTDENMQHFQLLHLRKYFNKNNFYKKFDLEKDVTPYFEIGRVIDGGMQPVGMSEESQAKNVTNYRHKNKYGKSFLSELLADSEVTGWTEKKYKEIKQKNSQFGSAKKKFKKTKNSNKNIGKKKV